MIEEEKPPYKKRQPKKITPQRLKNIALYYLKRFESSTQNLRQVLRRRVNDYAYHNPEWHKQEAYEWIEELLADFERLGYLDDARYAEMKVKDYAASGKSARYIVGKLKLKGIGESEVIALLENQEYDPFAAALHFAKKKKIGPFRDESVREENRQKDLGALVRAGFDYDTASQVLSYEV